MLPRHSIPACQNKYRMLKNKVAKDKEANSNLRIPAVDESSQSDQEQGLKESVEAGPSQHNEGPLATVSPAQLNGFEAVNKDVANLNAQSGGEN
jgi:hypothetical protein